MSRRAAARLLTALATVALAAPAAAEARPLRQSVDEEGVVRLTNLSVSDCRPPACRDWVDPDGVRHITLRGPSPQARDRASRQTVRPRANPKAPARVHETTTWDDAIFEAAQKQNIPNELVRAIIVAESNFDPGALSPKGAQGLMQLMPGTAKEMYVEDPSDPVQNIHGGVRYLRVLANMFQGDLVRTIAAYNAGPEAVRKAGGIPRYAETQEYVRRVVRFYRIYKGLPG